MDYKIEDWANFWQFFDALTNSLLECDKRYIASDIKSAQRYFNGFTDGLHDFIDAFFLTIDKYQDEFTIEQLSIITRLRQHLCKFL